MNVYIITRCPNCKEPVVIEDRIMVHGAKNATDVMGRIRNNDLIEDIGKEYCGHCGNKLPCGCSNPTPQF